MRVSVGAVRGPTFLEVGKGFPEELIFELKCDRLKVLNKFNCRTSQCL